MNIEEMKKDKKELEEQILIQLKDFQNKYKCNIHLSETHLNIIRLNNEGYNEIIDIRIEVKY